MAWFIYETNPVDFWDGLPTLQEYATRKAVTEMVGLGSYPYSHVHLDKRLNSVVALCEEAHKAARENPGCNWGGDIKAGPFVLLLPEGSDPDLQVIGFVWKQANNGTTFIVSQVPFPHLDKYAAH